MDSRMSKVIFLILISVSAIQTLTNSTEKNVKEGKVFSLFSIVQFKNTGCRTQSSMTSGQSPARNGTCYTSSECSSKGGTPSGNCAAGFGVCCLFLFSTTGSTINQNCSYLRNPSFPSTYTATSALSYTVSKCSNDVCFLRLDFETFTLVGPLGTAELAAPTPGATCPDQFKVVTNTGQSVPIICGTNTGQHTLTFNAFDGLLVYLDMGNLPSDTVTLSFTFSTLPTTTPRLWELKISQITCSSASRPPSGCLQYFTTPTGRFTTFNFIPTLSTKLDTQQYNICIRQNVGFCCVQYMQCFGVPNSFSLDASNTMAGGAPASAAKGSIDTSCTGDYITIAGSGIQCSSSAGKLSSKYCGSYFPLYGVAVAPMVIANSLCDCTAPFYVGIRTDALQAIALPANNIIRNRGVCLDYTQVPCNG